MDIKTLFQSLSNTGLTRRKFLNLTWLSALAIVILQLCRMTISLLTPRVKAGEFGSTFTIGTVMDLPSKDDPPANFPKGKFWLLRDGDQLRAFYNNCTHLDCLFKWNPQEKTFICPCHGSKFDTTGKVLTGPAPKPLEEFVIQIILPDGTIHSQTDPRKGLLIPQIAQDQTNTGDTESESTQVNAFESIPNGISHQARVMVDTSRIISNTTNQTG